MDQKTEYKMHVADQREFIDEMNVRVCLLRI